jgi:preprotein translocase subunit SecA
VARRLPKQGLTGQRVRHALLDIAGDALESEKEHALRATRTMLEKTGESIEQQKSERVDALDAFFEGLRSTEDEEGSPPQPKRPMELLEELSGLARVQFRLSPEQLRRLPQGDEDIKDYLRSQVQTGLLALAAGRLVGAIEHRLQEPTGLKPASLASLNFDEIGDQMMQAVEKIFDNRKSRLLGETGQLANDLEPALDRMGQAALEDNNVLSLMNTMVYGQRMAFDRKTHRQGWQRYERISYTYLAARLLENMSSEQVTAGVLEHLQGARQALHEVWGQSEWRRLAQNDVTFRKFDERAQDIFRETLGAERFEEIAELPFISFTAADAALTAQALGRRTQNEITRQLLLNVISDQWVEYLTKVEGLRVSIGLEAYAQRNPLVEYKGRASEMFRQLLVDVRSAVISRLFTYQPARTAEAAVERPAERAEQSEKAQPVQSQPAQSAFPARQEPRPSDGRKKKHKRH